MNLHCYRHQTVDVGDSVRTSYMAFYGYHGWKDTEDKDAIQIISPLTGNGNKSARAITFLCKFFLNKKHLQKLVTLEILIIRKKRKISVRCFQSKFEVGNKKKTLFTMLQFLLLPSLTKPISFPSLLLSTHTQSNTESSQHICALHHGQYKHLKKQSTAQNYNNSTGCCFVTLIS